MLRKDKLLFSLSGSPGEVAESSLSEGPGLVQVEAGECEEGDGCFRPPKPQVQGVWGQGGSLPLWVPGQGPPIGLWLI